jgi:hypothetical protein
VVRYDDVNMDSDVSSISMSINNRLLTTPLNTTTSSPKVDSNPIVDRVRRKRQRLPSSRCIKSDRRTFSRLRNSSSAVASDTTLGLLDSQDERPNPDPSA